MFFLTKSMHIPAATVCPASLIANLDICGMSAFFSNTKGFVGLTFTTAASPFFSMSGFSSTVSPVAGLIFLTNSVI